MRLIVVQFQKGFGGSCGSEPWMMQMNIQGGVASLGSCRCFHVAWMNIEMTGLK